ncbi:formate dehydrogenase accessory sulfurtransferase FdhD [Thermus thermamylovorans]|uniref:Sulfurtransferase FdhD n=1 Tax=Thermus thermamylovorans TaxID=2509362 RepID=A0A4V2IV57_9DEIN|nr:formate dehydrogenase accessory sulfurtransferase FdhD [Thermus thermamylovorans]TBH21034.1 sulfurtransferase FdhD [Thermus thermamylovorans]
MYEYRRGEFLPGSFELPQEGQLEIHLNGAPYLSLACSPGGEVALGLGHLWLSGVFGALEEVRYRLDLEARRLHVDLPYPPPPLRPHRYAGCAAGIGHYGSRPLQPLPPGEALDPELPLRMVAQLQEAASGYRRTRGIHGAALFDLQGRLLHVAEDIGRHNAVDRLAGWLLLEGRMGEPCLIAITGRVSEEMAAKAVALKAPLLASRTGAMDRAVALARHYRLTLACYVRQTGYRLYAAPERLVGAAPLVLP